MGIKPLGDRVVVEALSEEERVKKTKFGLVLPDTADRNKVDRGRVVAVGAGKMDKSGKRVPLEVKAGQVVIFPEFSSEKIKVDGKDILVEVNFDKKTGVSKLIKLIGDFYEKKRNEINFAEYLDPEGKPLLQDRQRFSMAIKGNNKAIEKIIMRVNMFFENVVEKPINTGHGQNPTVKKRFIGEYKGVPFEMVYYDQEGFINSKNHVGKKSQKKIPVKIRDKEFEAVFDIFDGSAHDLYEIRRSLPIIFLIFPYEIYRQPNQSPEDYVKMIQEAVRSRISDVVLNLRRSVH